MSYSIHGVDWTKYLDRKQPLVLFSAFIRPYGTLLQEVTGFRFMHQLHVFSEDSGTFYKSAKELDAAISYFHDLVAKQDPRLIEWKEKGITYNKEADKLLEKFRTDPPAVDASSFRPLYEACERVMLYDTTIPFRVMVSINSEVEKQGEGISDEFKHALEMFEPFRARAKYPELVDVIFPHIWKSAADLCGIEDASLLSCAVPPELYDIFEKGAKLDQEVLMRRRDWCAFWEDPQTGKVEFTYDQNELKDIGIFADYSDVREVKGNIAFKGVAKGKARILNSVADIKEFDDGDIIVSFNTNPSLMPAILKCGGIVTDEGGIMCHAAIVSREFKKPCVIGTKVATKVFKEGDMIEVDAERGIVSKV